MSQARIYISFMIEYHLEVFTPTHVDIMLYTQLLVNSNKTLRTIRNYLSGAKLFVAERGGAVGAFSHHMVANFLKGFKRKTLHVPHQAVALQANTIRRLCSTLCSLSGEGEVLAASVLFAFTTMLRQCHMFYTPHGYMHIIRRGDLEHKHNSILVTVRSSKTTGCAHASVIPIHGAASGGMCPVQALRRALALAPGGPADPVFLQPGSGRPFTAARANLLLHTALAAAGFRGANLASFHSLRRSSAQACVKAGLPLEEVKAHGLWRSAAVCSYVPQPLLRTSRVLNAQLTNHE